MSGKVIREEFPDLREIFGGNSFPVDGCFAETAGQVNVEYIRKYIKTK